MNLDIDNLPKVEFTPIGFVKSEIKAPMLHAGDSDLELKERMDRMREHQKKIRNNVSELIVSHKWIELLDGIDGFSHVLVLYWPHLIAPERRNLQKVHPMGRKDLPMQGIFATCSPARPNPILVTAVRLLEKTGTVLKVKGLEAVDGSPILDIKPYSEHYYRVEKSTSPEWMEQIHREMKIEEESQAEKSGESR